MNIWDEQRGEQAEDWSGGGGLAKRLVPSGPQLGVSLYELERQLEEGEVVHFPTGPAGAHAVTGHSKHGIFFIHDVEENT
jgi:hypothetical protein